MTQLTCADAVSVRFDAISIIVPTFERGQLVAELVARIARQLAPGDELIILDDASLKDPVALIGSPPGVRVIRNPTNLGMVGNWNRCFEVASNNWVCTVHDDDEFAPDGLKTLRRAIGLMSGHAGVIVSGSLPEAVDRTCEFRYRYTDPGPWAVLHATTIPSGATIHRQVFQSAGVFDPQYAFSADLELFARYAARFPTLCIESPAVVTYRIHAGNLQFKTWRDSRFVSQLEQIVRTIGEYASLAGPELNRYIENTMTNYLTHIMRLARANGDLMVYRDTARRLRTRPGIGRRTRLRAWIASTIPLAS